MTFQLIDAVTKVDIDLVTTRNGYSGGFIKGKHHIINGDSISIQSDRSLLIQQLFVLIEDQIEELRRIPI